MSDDWGEFVGAAFAIAVLLFALLFLKFGDFSSMSAMTESTSNFLLAIGYSLKPTGLSLWIDLIAAVLTGVVSFRAVQRNVLMGIFGGLVLYFFLAIIGNYLFVVT